MLGYKTQLQGIFQWQGDLDAFEFTDLHLSAVAAGLTLYVRQCGAIAHGRLPDAGLLPDNEVGVVGRLLPDNKEVLASSRGG